MEEAKLEIVYKIDKERLLNYYNRIKNQNKEALLIGNITKFLNNQSIGSSYEEVFNTLKFFEDKLAKGKGLLDLAFEWIRAHKIRLEYKKYLIRAQYPNNDLCLAIDDCIYKFFLKYDKYIRILLFKKDIREHNISALYEIFFSPFNSKNLKIEDILQKHMHNIPTHYCGANKINTRIMTLREGLSNIIVKDYENVLFSRNDSQHIKESKFQKISKSLKYKRKISCEFNGSNIERIIKTYCFNKMEIPSKVIESSITNFLNSYLKFGIFFKFDEFKDLLIQNLAEFINSGLTGKVKEFYPIEKLKKLILNTIDEFRSIHKIKELDGSAWVYDLKPVLKEFLINFFDNLF
jgi:hypothetical protein